MLSDFTGAEKVYIACGYTDLRRGIDGLAALVQQQFDLNPFTNTLFLFCSRRRDRIKALYWEGNGFLLLYKRLESGSFQWPRKESEARALAHGGFERGPAKGAQAGFRAGNSLKKHSRFYMLFCTFSCKYDIISVENIGIMGLLCYGNDRKSASE